MKLLRLHFKRYLVMRSKNKMKALSRIKIARKFYRPVEEGDALVVSRRWIGIYSNGQHKRALLTGQALPMPEQLSLETNYEDTCNLLNQMRVALRSSWRSTSYRINRKIRRANSSTPSEVGNYWDFTSLKSISPEVALILASEYDIISRKNGWLPRAIAFDSWDNGIKRMLDGIGFLDLVGINRGRREFVVGDRWKILRFRSGREADGKLVYGLLEDLGLGQIIDDPELYGAIVEAITNTRHHAYPGDVQFAEPHIPDWWMTGFVDVMERRVRISVFDQGVTIPRTLRAWQRYPAFVRGWRRLFRSMPNEEDTSRDGMTIALAMAVGRSSTNEGYRGRGLPRIEAAIDSCRQGRLTIYSRCGTYVRETGSRPRH